MLRLAGAAAAGGVTTALAGCSSQDDWHTDRENRVTPWLYDLSAYGASDRHVRLDYWEPVTFERNRTYVEAETQELLRRWHWGDPWAVDHALRVTPIGAADRLPTVSVSQGSFGVEAVESRLGVEIERVGTHDGRPLYRFGGGIYGVLDHGELVVVENTDRRGGERYLDATPWDGPARDPALTRFFETVGMGAQVRLERNPDGQGPTSIGGYAYRLDGPTTRARSIAVPGVSAEAQRELERVVARVQDRKGVFDVETTFADEYTLFEVTVRTGLVRFGTGPLFAIDD